MQIVHVNLPHQPYKVIFSENGIDTIGELLVTDFIQFRDLKRKVLIVSNPEIFQYYGQRVVESLEKSGFQVSSLLIDAGEQFKTFSSIQKIYNAALEHRLERSSTIIALGGGVVGDLAGFAASTWLRGISLVQIPTSLLSMVDSAIGGKTGVNHPQGKNLIGTFYQPNLVIVDRNVLSTLPSREFRSGLAEVIKYGVIWDADLFKELETAESLQQKTIQPQLLKLILTLSCQAKADIVVRDEKESDFGLRILLNYGHTVGHAIESITNYRQYTHGEAVALGMIAAGEIAVASGWWNRTAAQRQLALIEKVGLPTSIPKTLEIERILETIALDKKVKNGKVRFILPTGIGKAEITEQVNIELITQCLLKMQSSNSTSSNNSNFAFV